MGVCKRVCMCRTHVCVVQVRGWQMCAHALAHVCARVYMCGGAGVCTCSSTRVCTSVHMYVWVQVRAQMCALSTWGYVCVHLCVHGCRCMFAHAHVRVQARVRVCWWNFPSNPHPCF